MHVAVSTRTLECRENVAAEKSAVLLLRERMKTKAEQKEQTFSCFYFFPPSGTTFDTLAFTPAIAGTRGAVLFVCLFVFFHCE